MKGFLLLLCVIVLGVPDGIAQNTLPPIPQNLVAMPTPNNPLAVRLEWEVPPGPWKFRVYRSADDTMNFQPIAMTQVPVFVNHGLLPGHTYYYAVTSVVLLGAGTVLESPRSNIAGFTTGPPPPRGVISGTVTDDSTGAPIHHVRITFKRVISPALTGPHVFTDSLGRYRAVLDTGTYYVRAEKLANTPTVPGYVPEWYDDAQSIADATQIVVADSSLFVADFGLTRFVLPAPAFIEGVVTDTLGTPLPNATVAIKRTIQNLFLLAATTGEVPGLGLESANIEAVGHARGVVWIGRTDSLGMYRAHVRAGESYIAMASKPGYLPEFFENKQTPAEADVIVLGGDTSGINFSLALNPLLQNSISGVVKDSLGTGVPSRVMLLPIQNSMPVPSPSNTWFTLTDSNGVYSMSMVPAGRYFVFALPFSGYGPAFYKEGAYGVIHRADADTVLISGNVTGIDIGVVPINTDGLAQIRGRIRSTSNAPLSQAHVYAFQGRQMVGYGLTDVDGRYHLEAVSFGPVRIVVERAGYEPAERVITVTGTPALQDIDVVMIPSSPLSVSPEEGIPSAFALQQNYPNPFNPATTISFNLPVASTLSLKVYNLIGQEVATLAGGVFAPGRHEVVWEGKDGAGRAMASGLYFYKLKATPLSGGSEFSAMRKMALVK